MLVLENNTLLSLARRPEVVKEFPFLKQLLRAATDGRTNIHRCGKCSRKAGLGDAYANAKAYVLAMSGSKKIRFKEILGADKVRIFYLNSRKRVIDVVI